MNNKIPKKFSNRFSLTLKTQQKATSQRKEIKKFLAEIEKENPVIIKNIFKMTSNVNMNKILGWKTNSQMHSFLDDYEKKSSKN